MSSSAKSIAFVVPYGEPKEGFLPDSLMALLCGVARQTGHEAALVRVHYQGDRGAGDARVRQKLRAWIAERDPALVVLDRIFDAAPFAGRRVLMVSRGESFDPVEGVDLWIGSFPGWSRRGVASRRTPMVGELVAAFRGVLERLGRGEDPADAAGVGRIAADGIRVGEASAGVAALRPFRPAVDAEVIAPDVAPVMRRKTLFGNSGCPYGSDPIGAPHYRGLELANDGSMARLGCAFCHMGGDYQKRADEEVVAELVEQAVVWTRACPEVEELVLNDQHPMRYLASLMDAARAAEVRPVRWLFAARADAFVREREQIEAAIGAASRAGQVLEVYLSGFEAFSDRELERYHKGTTVAEMVRAVEVMRELRRAHPGAFDYARARGHSLILWNPWTAPEDLAESVAHVRAHGLAELFHEMGRNRLRLYRDLPIHAAAERDGAVADTWDEGDEGAGRAKGYNPERPWRFLDPRTAAAHRVAKMLRETLGAETEVAQLAAVSAWAGGAGGPGPSAPVEVRAGCEALRDALAELTVAKRAAGQPERGATESGAVVLFAGACNNGCVACANRDSWLDDSLDAVLARVEAARATGARAIVLAGREPSVHPDIERIVRAARGDDGRRVAMITNGRRFAYARFAQALVGAGLTSASVKLFAPGAERADAIARVEGAHAQALSGLRALATAGLRALEIRVPLHRDNLDTLTAYAQLAARAGVRQLRVEAALDAIGLDDLAAAATAIRTLAAACARAGVALDASPLESATRHFARIPSAPR